MKAAIRALRNVSYRKPQIIIESLNIINPPTRRRVLLLCRYYTAQPQEEGSSSLSSDENNDSVFDSSHYSLPTMPILVDSDAETCRKPTWEAKYREKANKAIFGEEEEEEIHLQSSTILDKEQEKRRRAATTLAKALLEAALQQPDQDEDEDGSVVVVKEEDQKSLSVGIIGAPNAGKSALTNYMVCLLSFHFLYLRLCL